MTVLLTEAQQVTETLMFNTALTDYCLPGERFWCVDTQKQTYVLVKS